MAQRYGGGGYLDFSDLELPEGRNYPESPIAAMARHREKARRRQRQKFADLLGLTREQTELTRERLGVEDTRRKMIFEGLTRPYELEEKERKRRQAIIKEPWELELTESPVKRKETQRKRATEILAGQIPWGDDRNLFTPEELSGLRRAYGEASVRSHRALAAIAADQTPDPNDLIALSRDPALKQLSGIIRSYITQYGQTGRQERGFQQQTKERIGGQQFKTGERIGGQEFKAGESEKERAIKALRIKGDLLESQYRGLRARQPIGADAKHFGDVLKFIRGAKDMMSGDIPPDIVQRWAPFFEQEEQRLTSMAGAAHTPQATAVANQSLLQLSPVMQDIMATLDQVIGGAPSAPSPPPELTGAPQVTPSGLHAPDLTPRNLRQPAGVVNALAPPPSGAETPYNFSTARAMQMAGQMASMMESMAGAPERYAVGGRQYEWGPKEREQAQQQYIQREGGRQQAIRAVPQWWKATINGETWIVPEHVANELPGNVKRKRISRDEFMIARNLAYGGLYAKAVGTPKLEDYALAKALFSGEETRVGSPKPSETWMPLPKGPLRQRPSGMRERLQADLDQARTEYEERLAAEEAQQHGGLATAMVPAASQRAEAKAGPQMIANEANIDSLIAQMERPDLAKNKYVATATWKKANATLDHLNDLRQRWTHPKAARLAELRDALGLTLQLGRGAKTKQPKMTKGQSAGNWWLTHRETGSRPGF